MFRIGGVILSESKKIQFALLKIKGIGFSSAFKLLAKAHINPNLSCISLSANQRDRLRILLEQSFTIETFLTRKNFLTIKHLIFIRSLRGKRHQLHLPVRGQRTRTNARTKRGKKVTVSMKKK